MDQMFAAVGIVTLPMLKEGSETRAFDAAQMFSRFSGFGKKFILATKWEALATEYTEEEGNSESEHGPRFARRECIRSAFHRPYFPVLDHNSRRQRFQDCSSSWCGGDQEQGLCLLFRDHFRWQRA